MKKRFKKRYFIGIILLLIGGYWLSQNTWVFEKQIPKSEYGEFLGNTIWKSNSLSGAEVTWLFFNSGKYEQHYYSEYVMDGKGFSEGTWIVVDGILIFNYNQLSKSDIEEGVDHFRLTDIRKSRIKMEEISAIIDDMTGVPIRDKRILKIDYTLLYQY